MLHRKIEKKIEEYFSDKEAKILMIEGARQIGKSYIIREMAKMRFPNYIEIDLKADKEGPGYFKTVNSIDSFYLQLSALFGDKLGTIDDTIVFLDEIQTYPQLITLLKSLKKDSRYRYITSGSLLGITMRHTFIPMGSVEEVKMYPLDFEEFLIAYGVSEEIIDYLRNCFNNLETIEDGIHKIMLQRFKEYLISGGLPDSVNEYILNKNVYKCRLSQEQTYKFYKDDSTQYDIEHSLKIRTIYDSLPSYMENKVKRINFKKIEGVTNANLVRYQDEFDYLIYSGCALPIKAVSNPIFPLLESSSKNLIKLYFNDVGILTDILYKTNINAILNNDKFVNLGSVYETACAMELIAHGHELYYFDSKKVGEVDFLVNDYDSLSVVPIEIKSGNDQNNFRAIPKLVKEPYSLKKGYIFGNENKVGKDGNLITLPIYMIMLI